MKNFLEPPQVAALKGRRVHSVQLHTTLAAADLETPHYFWLSRSHEDTEGEVPRDTRGVRDGIKRTLSASGSP